MCNFPSCNVTKNKKILWDKDIHSHSELSQLFRVNDDTVAKYEWNLRSFSLIIDEEHSWVKQSHRDAAERHFRKHYGTPEALIRSVKKLNPEKFERFWDLYALLRSSAQQRLPMCPYRCPYRCPYPCPSQYPSLSLKSRQARDWTRAWKKKWIELYSDPKNRI